MRTLDSAAQKVRAHGTLTARVGGASPELQATLAVRRDKVLGWLYQTASEAMWPTPDAAADVERGLLSAIAGICLGDWSSLDGELPATAPTDRLKRALPRLAVAAGLLAGAWIIPELLGKALSDSAVATLRVSLAITALSALLAPADALRETGKTVASFGRSRGE